VGRSDALAIVEVSDFHERSDVDGLDKILKGFDLLLKVVTRHFLVFDGASDNQFVDSERDWVFLVLGLPEESVHDDFGKDLRGDNVKVGLGVERLYLE